MKKRIPTLILASSLLTIGLSTSPATGQTVVEERYKSETYRSGAAAMPTASPAPRVIEQHRTETTVEHAPPPPPPPATVEKRTFEEKTVTE